VPGRPRALNADSAFVHLWASYPGAMLQLRSSVDEGPWQAACPAPCDRVLTVEGTEARVVAPGMSPSNTFRIEPGAGTAAFKVNGGSTEHRRLGTIALVAGIPLSLGGMGLWGYGRVEDKDGMKVAGAITLAVGGVLVIGSLPLLSAGSTRVYDSRGKNIARRFAPPRM
jgi:hypothetical protein